MKIIALLSATTLLSITLLSGCSSQHIIATKDGRLIETDSKPKLDTKTGMYTFEDEEGRESSLPKEDVKQIIER